MYELLPRRRYRAPLVRPGNDFIRRFFEDAGMPDLRTAEKEWFPAFDVSESDGEIIVKAELPGMNVKDIDITLTDGLLTIKGEKKKDEEDKQENYHRIERQYGSFSRSLSLAKEVKTDAIDASYKDGVLTVTLPKAEERKPKRIEVKD